jgi:hypothetical protein
MNTLLIVATLAGVAAPAALFQTRTKGPSPGRGGAPPGWNRVLKLTDGRTFVTDGAMTLDAALARPSSLPAEVLGEGSAKVIEKYMAAQLPNEIDLGQLRASGSDRYVAPDGLALNAGYVDYLRAALPVRRVRLRMNRDLDPIIILLDGKPVGLVMALRSAH